MIYRYFIFPIAAFFLFLSTPIFSHAQEQQEVNHLYVEQFLERELWSTSSSPDDRTYSAVSHGTARYELARMDTRGGLLRLWRSCEDPGHGGPHMREFLFSWSFDRDIAIVDRATRVVVDARLERVDPHYCDSHHGYPTVVAINCGTAVSVPVRLMNPEGLAEVFHQDFANLVDHGFLRLKPDFGITVPSAQFSLWTRESFWGPRDPANVTRSWWGFTVAMGANFQLDISYLYQARFNAPEMTNAVPPAPVSQVWKECETYTDTICGTWTWDASGQFLQAQWDNEAAAILTVESRTDNEIVLVRSDRTGNSAGLTARYVGRISNGQIQGNVTWSWQGSTWSGTWSATWPPY